MSEADIATLEGFAAQPSRIVAADSPDIAEFLHASHGYHSYLVGLAKCAQLSHTYDRLGISALWRRAISGQPWWLKFDVQHHTQLTQACRDGDTARAKQLIYEHADRSRPWCAK